MYRQSLLRTFKKKGVLAWPSYNNTVVVYETYRLAPLRKSWCYVGHENEWYKYDELDELLDTFKGEMYVQD